jgi:hypothetical protein
MAGSLEPQHRDSPFRHGATNQGTRGSALEPPYRPGRWANGGNRRRVFATTPRRHQTFSRIPNKDEISDGAHLFTSKVCQIPELMRWRARKRSKRIKRALRRVSTADDVLDTNDISFDLPPEVMVELDEGDFSIIEEEQEDDGQ